MHEDESQSDVTQENGEHPGYLGPSLYAVKDTSSIAEKDETPHESLLLKTRLLMGVNDLAVKLNQTDPRTDVGMIVAEHLRDTCGAIMVLASSYYHDERVVMIDHISSGGWALKTVNKIAQRNVKQVKYPVTDEIYERWLQSKIEVFSSTYDLTLGALPKPVCILIDKALGVGHTYGVALQSRGEIIGVLTIMMPSTSRPLPLDVLAAMANMLSASLQRIEVQRALEQQKEELRSLASELSLAEEKERRRIATLMHDEVTQTLALMALRLGQLQSTQVEKDSLGLVGEIAGLLDKSIQQTRTLTFELSSPILYELGLDPALQWLAEQLKEQHEIESQWESDGLDKPLAEDVRVVLFQTVRELLLNVRKHAQAGSVLLSSSRTDGSLSIVVSDDGIGFEPEAPGRYEPKSGGFGLFNIRERLSRLGASVEIDSSPGNGTTITLTAPLNTQNDSEVPA